MLAAFVLSGISPACKFLSGAGFMLICGADGVVKQVEIPDDLLAYIPGQQQQNQNERNAAHMSDNCAFCFASANVKPFMTASALLPLSIDIGYLKIGSGSFVPAGQAIKPYDAQGPPSSFA